MKVIIGKRQTGRTSQAIRIANRTGAYLAVRNHRAATEVGARTNRFPLTHHELSRECLRGSYIRNIVIDDLEEFLLQVLPGLTIEAVVLEKEEPWPENTPKRFEDTV
jgi:hypothetical protein